MTGEAWGVYCHRSMRTWPKRDVLGWVEVLRLGIVLYAKFYGDHSPRCAAYMLRWLRYGYITTYTRSCAAAICCTQTGIPLVIVAWTSRRYNAR
jgi:hypothetical protein